MHARSSSNVGLVHRLAFVLIEATSLVPVHFGFPHSVASYEMSLMEIIS